RQRRRWGTTDTSQPATDCWSANAVHLGCGHVEDMNFGWAIMVGDLVVTVLDQFGDNGDPAGCARARSVPSSR
ncbi:MAG: hypothetical protein ACREX8_03180, partial [Gammaproteobacteria bacterium]